MKEKHRSKNGMSLIIIIGILGILFISVMSYNNMLRSERRHMYRIIYSDNALIIAEAAMDVLQKVIENEFAQTGYERKNVFFKYEDLIKPVESFDTVCFNSAKLKEMVDESKPVQKLIELFGGSKVVKISEVEAIIDKATIKPFGDGGNICRDIISNPCEKFGIIKFHVAIEYYGIKKHLNIKRQFKVVNILPKVFRFFTLFIKNVPQNSPVNKLLVNQNGTVLAGKPLILNNGDFNKESSPQNLGVIFLGNAKAEEPLKLKLSHSSNNKAMGETFQLFDGYYSDKNYQKKYSAGKYIIGHVDYGISSEMGDNNNKYGFVSKMETYSSTIKLYGAPGNPSPAKVLGNVNRCYLKLSVYQDKASKGMDYMGEMPFSLSSDFKTMGITPLAEKNESPIKFHSCESIAKKIFPPTLSYDELYGEYSNYMNQMIVSEPYNYALLNFIKDKNKLYCNPSRITDLEQLTKPDRSNSYGGKPVKPIDSQYAGNDLRKISIDENYIMPYVSYKFNGSKDFSEFKKLFIETANDGTNVLNLGLAASFDADVTLPAMCVEKGGIIVCRKGNITITGDLICDPRHNQILTLIALDGQIEIDAKRVDAILIAMKPGTCFSPKRSFIINGTLAVNSIDFSKLSQTGGEINFNTFQSLKQSASYFYYASLQPDIRNWEMEDFQ